MAQIDQKGLYRKDYMEYNRNELPDFKRKMDNLWWILILAGVGVIILSAASYWGKEYYDNWNEE